MPPKIQKPIGERRPTYIKEWRKHRGLTIDRLADRTQISKATLSRIENGKQPYTQDILEVIADALSCEPADLIMRDPTAGNAIWSLWEQATTGERDQIERVVRALIETNRKAG